MFKRKNHFAILLSTILGVGFFLATHSLISATPQKEKTLEEKTPAIEKTLSEENKIIIEEKLLPDSEMYTELKKENEYANFYTVHAVLEFDVSILEDIEGVQVRNHFSIDTLYISINVAEKKLLQKINMLPGVYGITKDAKRTIN